MVEELIYAAIFAIVIAAIYAGVADRADRVAVAKYVGVISFLALLYLFPGPIQKAIGSALESFLGSFTSVLMFATAILAVYGIWSRWLKRRR